MAFINMHFFSQALGQCVTADVILPQRQDCARGGQVPVLWLLHGMTGNHSDWMRRTAIERYVEPYGLAVVMSSAQNSHYADMAHGGRYYTYFSKELLSVMRDAFPLSEKREDNFIAGLSMGGAGSMMIGLANPENYAAIGCLSAGAMNWEFNASGGDNDRIAVEKDPTGTYFDPYYQAKRILDEGKPAPRIFHAIGGQDFLLNQAHKTKSFFGALPGNPFGYVYEEDEGSHTWEYWDEHIRHFLKFLNLPVTEDQYY